MIHWQGISKKYEESYVLQDFSGQLPETGFFLLLGESGSGKTTFLNILAGLIPFESGTIGFKQEESSGTAPKGLAAAVEYITQDSFFVDFLTVEDNLRLLGRPEAEQNTLLARFGLEDTKNQYPVTLSGGERARLAIIRALLSGKKILLLDEPTAALDEGNKNNIFAMLEELGQSCLILCATHDREAKSYANGLFLFDKEKARLSFHTLQAGTKDEAILPLSDSKEAKQPSLIPFLKQWFRFRGRNKSADIRFVIFLFISFCLILLGDTYSHKLLVTSRNLFRSNCLSLTLPAEIDLASFGIKGDDILEVSLSYRGSLPDEEKVPMDDSGLFFQSPTYSAYIFQLPMKEEAFSLRDKIIYGRYAREAGEAIVTEDMARKISGGQIEKAIGYTIGEELYGLGNTSFTVVGVLGNLTMADCVYLNGIGAEINLHNSPDEMHRSLGDLFFISALSLQSLWEDDSFFSFRTEVPTREYYIFFTSTEAMLRFQREWSDPVWEAKGQLFNESMPNILWAWERYGPILLAVSASILLFVVLFYGQLRRTELIYNSRFISVFEHVGYNKKRVINSFIMLNMWCLIKQLLLAGSLAYVFTASFNYLNREFSWVQLELFTYNPLLMGLVLLCILLTAFLILSYQLKTVKVRSWYENLIAKRDIL